MATFGERLCALREERNLTQGQFGEPWGLAASTISGYENGTIEVGRKRLEVFADFFEVSLAYLCGRTDDRGPLTVNESPAGYGSEDVRVMLRNAGDLLPEDREELKNYINWLKHRRTKAKGQPDNQPKS